MRMPMRRKGDPTIKDRALESFWSIPADKLLDRLGSNNGGLTRMDAQRRLTEYGPNSVVSGAQATAMLLLLRQFRNPLVLILVFAAAVSSAVGETTESAIIAIIVFASCALSFTQEYRASKAMSRLTGLISRRASVSRDGAAGSIAADDIVPGDVVTLSAGNLIPADGIVLQARDFNVSEAALTGETFPVQKIPGTTAPDAPIGRRTNALFLGTSVRSGTAAMLVVRTGRNTEFANIASALERNVPETDFARGIRRFGYLMTEIMFAIVVLVFFTNVLLHRPLVESLLFSLALAVGLTPELLPAIISVTLARGAHVMAESGVIVRRLEAIENLGSMDLLCTDKTGTLTQGVLSLDGWLDPQGEASPHVLRWASLNATLQTGLKNPLDDAIAEAAGLAAAGDDPRKVDEIPYDFTRKRLSVVVREDSGSGDLMICKGAVGNVLDGCVFALASEGARPLDRAERRSIDEKFQFWSAEGYRVLAVAIRRFDDTHNASYGVEDESQMSFAGFLLFQDLPKAGVKDALAALKHRGVGVKVITGDNRYVAIHLAGSIGLRTRAILTGEDLQHMSNDALFARAPETDLFVEIDPNQKERIISALRRAGHVVGYLGDGINDAPALHAADVGISVDTAADVAREAADMILLQRDLTVLLRGVDDGRRTFANTMKYISITTSANFGNMVSMSLASFLLPFLPLLAKQILLNNLLSSIPSLAIADDNVDPEQIRTAQRWDIGGVRRFMVSFGLISTLFDLLTFGFLLEIVRASPDGFRTAWFMESLVTQLAIVLVIRTHKAFWRSRPSRTLLWLTVLIAGLALATPFLPGKAWFGFVPLAVPIICGIVLIALVYVGVSEMTKAFFFAREHERQSKLSRMRRRALLRPRPGAEPVDRPVERDNASSSIVP